MAPEGAAASAAASNGIVAPDSIPGGTSGTDKNLFIAAQAVSALGGLFGGFSANSSAKQEAELQERQAELAREEAMQDANLKADQVTKYQQSQARKYLSSGVTLQGTPIIMLEDTRRKGQAEVDALIRRGEAQAELLKAKAQITRSSGRNSLVGSLFGVGGGALEGYFMGRRLGIFGKPGSQPGQLDPGPNDANPTNARPKYDYIYNPSTGTFDIVDNTPKPQQMNKQLPRM